MSIHRADKLALKARRNANRKRVTSALTDAGIDFADLNHGSHLRIEGGWDVYPSSERWKGPSCRGTNINVLIALLAAKEGEAR